MLDLKTYIHSLNHRRLVKIRYARNKSGSYSLYLERCEHNTKERYFVNAIITFLPQDRIADENSLRLAVLRRDQQEEAILRGGRLGVRVDGVLFWGFAELELQSKNPKNREGYLNAVRRFDRLFPHIYISEITDKTAIRYIASLSELSTNTQSHYIKAMRHLLGRAVAQGLSDRNPFSQHSVRPRPQPRQYLTIAEIRRLESDQPTNKVEEQVRRAFLFSCITGLRLGDIRRLTPQMIKNGYLEFSDSKTKTPQKIKLPKQAIKLTQTNQAKSLPLPAYKTLRRCLFALCERNLIDRRITFHCARHTFATLLITQGVDIYTVKSLLGHKSVSTTEIYAKLVDSKKDSAIDKLDEVLRG